MTLADLVRRVEPAVVQVISSAKIGTGFIISRDGLVVTNAHVVGNDTYVGVRVEGSEPIGARARPLGRDEEEVDIAILSLPSRKEPYPILPIGDSDKVSRGEGVIAVGYPLGEILSGSPTITRGIISAIGRIESVSYLQTDAAINVGNSGGPLINHAGQVIGIVTMKIQHDETIVEGIGLAIAQSELSSRLPRLTYGISVRETYRHYRCGYAFDVPMGWHIQNSNDYRNVHFETNDGKGFLRVRAVDLPGWQLTGDFERDFKRFANGALSISKNLKLFNLIDRAQVSENRYVIRYKCASANAAGLWDCVLFCEMTRASYQRREGFLVYANVLNDWMHLYQNDRQFMLDTFRWT